jgi:hypothetical protein
MTHTVWVLNELLAWHRERKMPKYLTISDELQIVRGEGCGFLPGPPENDIESVETELAAWVADHPSHPDVAEAQRWLDAAAPRIERMKKERQLLSEVTAFRNGLVAQLLAQGDTWASWRVDRYYQGAISKYEKEARQRMGLD